MLEAADAIEKLEMCCNHLERDYKELCSYLPKWNPVTERLPEERQDVLVSFKDNMAVAYHEGDDWIVNSGGNWCTPIIPEAGDEEPTHWMPLPPEPPKEE